MCTYLPGGVCSWWTVFFLFYYRRVDLSRFFQETSQFRKELSCFLTTSLGGRYRKLAGTATLAYRIVITTAKSVLELVSMFQPPCSSHRQETDVFLPLCLSLLSRAQVRFVFTRFVLLLLYTEHWDVNAERTNKWRQGSHRASTKLHRGIKKQLLFFWFHFIHSFTGKKGAWTP